MTNNCKPMIDHNQWVQITSSPFTGVAGTTVADDGERFQYWYGQTSATAAQFWKFDTFSETWEQLATPATQTGTVSDMVYTNGVGGQWSGKVYGAVYLFVGNGTTAYFYKYDIATNVWSANLGTVNVPATFATDARLNFPHPSKNNYELGYHSGYTRTITTSALATAGATTVSVTALPEALAAGTVLRFGTYNISITGAVAKGATTLTVTGVTTSLASGTILPLSDGYEICLNGAVTSGATSITVFPLLKSIASGTTAKVEKFAVLTAAAAASATSITVSALRSSLVITDTAPYYGNMYLIGNNATVMYRYNLGGNSWATTNAAGVAIPAVTGAVGTGCALKWLPAFAPDKLYVLRGGGTNAVYLYDLVANTWSTQTYYPNSETFTTGTCTAVKDINGKPAVLYIQKDSTMRIYEGITWKSTLDPKMTQTIMPTGSAVVGDRSCMLQSPDGIYMYYILLHSSNVFVRTIMIDS